MSCKLVAALYEAPACTGWQHDERLSTNDSLYPCSVANVTYARCEYHYQESLSCPPAVGRNRGGMHGKYFLRPRCHRFERLRRIRRLLAKNARLNQPLQGLFTIYLSRQARFAGKTRSVCSQSLKFWRRPYFVASVSGNLIK